MTHSVLVTGLASRTVALSWTGRLEAVSWRLREAEAARTPSNFWLSRVMSTCTGATLIQIRGVVHMPSGLGFRTTEAASHTVGSDTDSPGVDSQLSLPDGRPKNDRCVIGEAKHAFRDLSGVSGWAVSGSDSVQPANLDAGTGGDNSVYKSAKQHIIHKIACLWFTCRQKERANAAHGCNTEQPKH